MTRDKDREKDRESETVQRLRDNTETIWYYLPVELVSEYQYNSLEITREINMTNK